MAGLVPAIHVFSDGKDVDPRDEPGDDEEGFSNNRAKANSLSQTAAILLHA
jgi:hypothetical protein